LQKLIEAARSIREMEKELMEEITRHQQAVTVLQGKNLEVEVGVFIFRTVRPSLTDGLQWQMFCSLTST
jgi:hypothetical protein